MRMWGGDVGQGCRVGMWGGDVGQRCGAGLWVWGGL